MRKPPNLAKKADVFPVTLQSTSQTLKLTTNLDNGSSFIPSDLDTTPQTLDLNVDVSSSFDDLPIELETKSQELDLDVDLGDDANFFLTNMQSIQQVASIQPDWAQEDDKKPDYIKNKEIAEQVRPISIDGQEFLSEDRNSGVLNIIGTNGVLVSANNGSLCISGPGPNPELEICCETIKKVYNQEYLTNEKGEYIVDENGQRIPVGPAKGLLVDEIIRATNEEGNINTRITSLFDIKKDENNNTTYSGEIVKYVTDSVQNSLPVATIKRLGAVKASEEVNGISVNPDTGIMEINSISTDKLTQGRNQLILNGGDTELHTN